MQGAGRGGDATLWRRQVTAAPPPRAFGGLQLQRLLRLLSGRTPPTAPALCRPLLVVCTPQDAAADAASGGGARLLHARPQLACWWAGLEVARFLVSSRLRSPYGGPSHTFEALERFLVEAVAAHQAEAAAAAAAATSTGTAGTAAPAAAAVAGTAAAAAAGTAAGAEVEAGSTYRAGWTGSLAWASSVCSSAPLCTLSSTCCRQVGSSAQCAVRSALYVVHSS